MKLFGETATFDSKTTATKVFFKEYEDTTNSYDYKYMFSSLSDSINQGSYVNVLGCDWLTLSKPVNINHCYDKTIVRKTNYVIKIVIDNVVKQYKSIVDVKVLDVDTGQFINVPTGQIAVIIQNNTDANGIAIDKRFYFASKPYKITGVDKSKEGLITINAKLDVVDTVNDDVTNEIANKPTSSSGGNATPPASDTITYSITTTATSGFNVVRYNTNTYAISKTVNGTVDANAAFDITLDYNSNATTIATLTIVDTKTAKVKNNTAINNEVLYLVFTDRANSKVTKQVLTMSR
jgi:hypothetical protein